MTSSMQVMHRCEPGSTAAVAMVVVVTVVVAVVVVVVGYIECIQLTSLGRWAGDRHDARRISAWCIGLRICSGIRRAIWATWHFTGIETTTARGVRERGGDSLPIYDFLLSLCHLELPSIASHVEVIAILPNGRLGKSGERARRRSVWDDAPRCVGLHWGEVPASLKPPRPGSSKMRSCGFALVYVLVAPHQVGSAMPSAPPPLSLSPPLESHGSSVEVDRLAPTAVRGRQPAPSGVLGLAPCCTG